MKHDEKILVTVIVCFYNEERFIEETIESVLAQTLDNWELILVDDGSTDSSTGIAKNMAEAYPEKVKYIEHENHKNRGLSASRNLGISYARGEFVAFLDADDVWLPGKLERQVAILAQYQTAGMLCEASEYWYTWQGKNEKDVLIKVGADQDRLYPPGKLSELLYPLGRGAAPCPCSLIVRKSVLDKHNGFEAHFTGRLQLYEDQAFLQKIYLNEFVFVSSQCNNRYRKRRGSLVQKARSEGNYYGVRKYFLTWLKEYLQSNSIHNKQIDQLLKKAYRQNESPLLLLKTFYRKLKNLTGK
jgi:glycosyltransferase involved in cell wall biosynthesis